MALTTMAAALVLAACTPATAGVNVGDTAPDFQLTAVDGKAYQLSEYAGKVVVLEWTCPNCPFVKRHNEEKTMAELVKKYPNVVFLSIDSSAKSQDYYMDPATYQAVLKERGLVTPHLQDTTGEVGKMYDAKTTPHMFVVDEKGKVIYNGAIDSKKTTEVQTSKDDVENYVDEALAAHFAGKTPGTVTDEALRLQRQIRRRGAVEEKSSPTTSFPTRIDSVRCAGS
ncbi:MAG: redoxin family protein [Deltaproteobacteria bacterium]|nr:redoxin family protein [Deltaproteobacteria bacterium]